MPQAPDHNIRLAPPAEVNGYVIALQFTYTGMETKPQPQLMAGAVRHQNDISIDRRKHEDQFNLPFIVHNLNIPLVLAATPKTFHWRFPQHTRWRHRLYLSRRCYEHLCCCYRFSPRLFPKLHLRTTGAMIHTSLNSIMQSRWRNNRPSTSKSTASRVAC